MFEDLYRVSYAVLFVGHALAGIIAMRGDSVALRVAVIAGAMIGTVIASLLWPVWDRVRSDLRDSCSARASPGSGWSPSCSSRAEHASATRSRPSDR
jgi:hypothetical protein